MLFPIKQTNNWAVSLLLAITTAMAVAWVFDPALAGSTWLARSLLVGGCLVAACVLFRLELRRQATNETLARRHIESFFAPDPHDVSANKPTM
jgi:hypothetical protein